MELFIKNIGKIEKIDIEIQGITVLIGVNGTGKSTVNRSLYSILNSFCNTSYKILESKQKNITRAVEDLLQKLIFSTNEEIRGAYNIRSKWIGYSRKITKKIMDQYFRVEEKIDAQRVEEIIREEYDTSFESEEFKNDIDNIVNEINKEDIEYMGEIINRQFLKEFNEQVNNIDYKGVGEISLVENDTKIYVKFENNRVVDFSKLNTVRYNPIYIDTPYVLDFYGRFDFYDEKEEDHREKTIGSFRKRITDDDNIERIQESSKRLKLVNEMLNGIVDGKFSYDELGDITYENKITKNKLELSNLATGIKTFVIIKKLIENGTIDENTVLIIDEPEVHLHPEWQLKLAEILVNLGKILNIKILISTHSPYFLRAIQVYSAKCDIADKQRIYYIENNKKVLSVSKEITCNTDEVFEQLTKPFIDLEENLQ